MCKLSSLQRYDFFWKELKCSNGTPQFHLSATKQKSQPKWLAIFVLEDQTLRISNLSVIEGLLQIQAFIDRFDR